MKTFRIVMLFTLLPLVLSCSRGSDDNGGETQNHVKKGDKVPVFEMKTEGMSDFKSPDDFLGKKTLLVFFICNCPDCTRELPFVQYAQEQLSSKGLQVTLIGRDETRERVEKYWEEIGVTLPYYLDPGRKIFDMFANRKAPLLYRVPLLYLVDGSGTVKWVCIEDLKYGEFTEEKGKQFNELIKSELNIK